MQIQATVFLDARDFADQIAHMEDTRIIEFVMHILDVAARLELDEALAAHVYRGCVREYEAGAEVQTIQELMAEYP